MGANTYIDLKFTSWSGGTTGGPFSYLRSTPPLSLDNWRLQYFGTGTNTGNAANTFDYDKDGLANVIEYAFGLNPLLGSSLALPQPELLAGAYGVNFTQPAGISGITYKAEWSNSLAFESWIPIPDTGTGANHIFSVPAGNNPKLFFRYTVFILIERKSIIPPYFL